MDRRNNDDNYNSRNNAQNNNTNEDRETGENSNFVNNLMNNPREAIASELIHRAEENLTKSWSDRFNCNFEFLQVYFDITTDEVRDRIINSLIPFNPKFHDITNKSPDLYGPFWIYTTLIFIIAAAGSFTKYLEDDATQDYFQVYVPKAASIIYGIGFTLPFVLSCLMKCFGTDVGFVSVVCTYAYSFTIYIPTVLVCSFSFNSLQWLLIGYAVVSSTGFLLVNYWKELNKYVSDKRYFILGVIFICQVSLFFSLKMIFFAYTEKLILNNTIKK